MLQEFAIERPRISTNGRVVPHSKLTAHYEALLRQIQAANATASSGQTLGVISCAPGAGVSTVAFNIAVTAARADCGPILFVDANTSKLPGEYVRMGAPSLGLADVLVDAAEPLDCVERSSCKNLSIVCGRGKTQQSLSGVPTTKFAELLNEYKRHFSLVVVDIAAPTELNDSCAVAGQLDDVILVIEAERDDGRVALRTKQRLVDAGANLLGVVLNRRRQHVPRWFERFA